MSREPLLPGSAGRRDRPVHRGAVRGDPLRRPGRRSREDRAAGRRPLPRAIRRGSRRGTAASGRWIIDLATAEGRAEALELIDGADVVLENLRPGSMARLGLSLDELRARQPSLVTCSISAYGSSGPARDDPGWEPLVHARAGAQQGLFTGDQPIWLPFPMASVAAALLAVLGVGRGAGEAGDHRLRTARRDLPVRSACCS